MNLTEIYRPSHTKNTHSSQVHMKYSPRYIIYYTTKEILINLKVLKSCQALFWSQWYDPKNQLQNNPCKIHKYIEVRQHGIEQQIGQRRNQR